MSKVITDFKHRILYAVWRGLEEKGLVTVDDLQHQLNIAPENQRFFLDWLDALSAMGYIRLSENPMTQRRCIDMLPRGLRYIFPEVGMKHKILMTLCKMEGQRNSVPLRELLDHLSGTIPAVVRAILAILKAEGLVREITGNNAEEVLVASTAKGRLRVHGVEHAV
ncbi:MAG: hypothetical protein AB1665_05350 [Candidatus Thermoplasmatota archaeon]